MTLIRPEHVIEATARFQDYLALHGGDPGEDGFMTIADPRARAAMFGFIGLSRDGAQALLNVANVSADSTPEAMAFWSGCQFALYVQAVARESEVTMPPRSIEDELDGLGEQ